MKQNLHVMQLMVAAFLVLVGVGCKPNVEAPPPPPPSQGTTTGSLQAAYNNPSLASNNTNTTDPNSAASTAPTKVTRLPVKIGADAPMLGERDAQVTIVEYSDFQCPFCGKAVSAVKDILKKHPKTTRLFFKHYPLDFHKDAHLAAQAAMAAHAQGKFWEYHDKLFANMSKLKRDDLDRYAQQLKLDMAKFKKALDKKEFEKVVNQHMSDAKDVNVSGTPTFFVNGRQTGFKDLGDIVKDELKRTKDLVDEGLKGDALYKKILQEDKKEEKTYKIFVGNAPTKGPDNAPVTVVAFGDFQCPSFSPGAPVILQLEKAYKGKVRVAFKHHPHHALSKEVAKAAVAAHELGIFWSYYQKLLANSSKLDRDSLLEYANQLGIDREIFKNRMEQPGVEGTLDADSKQAANLELKNVPGFYVNGTKVENYSSFDSFKRMIDKILLAKGYKKEDLPEGPPPVQISLAGVPTKGAKNAPILLAEFSDFQCPFCSRVVRNVNQVLRLYKGKVRFAFKHFPLSFHKEAKDAAIAAMAAHKQGKFFPYHDLLFAKMSEIKEGRPAFLRFAKELNLDMAQFEADLNSDETKEHVEKDMSEGATVGVSGTPSFYVNGRKISGGDLKDLQKELNKELLKLGFKEADLPKGPSITTKGVPFKGTQGAPVLLAEFSDFQCPFCSRVVKTIEQIVKMYPKKLMFVFKHYPLSFHKQAKDAAIAAMAAHKQGKFFPYHDMLFSKMGEIKQGRPTFLRFAQELKLDMKKFEADLDSKELKDYVESDMDEGNNVGVNGTPSFFVNGKKVSDLSIKGLQLAINEALLNKGFKASDLPKGPPIPPITVGNAPFKGGEKAPVTLVEFSDFQCPFCGRAAKYLDEVAKAYGDKIKIVFKQFPLNFHKDAHLAAQAALAAHEQAKFWEYHDILFANMRNLKREDLLRYAKELSCDMSMFTQALDSGKFKAQVDADIKQGGTVEVSGTPTIFINNKKFEGRPTLDELKKIINPLLLKAGYKASQLP